MIGYLKGKIIDIDGHEVIVEVNGVGYLVKVAGIKYQELSEAELYIHTHVREDQLSLFGFETKTELKLFELLISVSGIGPKIGMSILRAAKSSAIQEAIAKADVGFFTTIPGIGKKGSQKIIIELKNKVGSLNEINLNDEGDGELITGLVGMGYDRKKVLEVMRKIDNNLTDQEKIKMAIKYISTG
jgi:Holliday junction DNA helicase RuvA